MTEPRPALSLSRVLVVVLPVAMMVARPVLVVDRVGVQGPRGNVVQRVRADSQLERGGGRTRR